MYSSLLPLASFPALAYAARKEMPFCWRYSVMLTATQLAITPLGVAFLLSAPQTAIAAAAVAVYIPFTMIKLVQSSLAFGKHRAIRGGDETQAQHVEDAKVTCDETETVVLGAAPSHPQCTMQLLERYGLKTRFEAAFPMISEAGKSSECIIAVLLLAGAASGFIGSVVGTSSPPQLFAFTYLDLTKGVLAPLCCFLRAHLLHAGAIRGVKVPATILANITRLLLLAFSGKPVLLLDEWQIYVGVCIASILGAGLGSCVREHVPKQLLLCLLYLLLWFTVADLLKVIHHPKELGAIVFYVASFVLLLLMGSAAAAPLRFAAALQAAKNTFSRASCPIAFKNPPDTKNAKGGISSYLHLDEELS